MGTAVAPTKRPSLGSRAKPQKKLAGENPAPRRTTVALSRRTLQIVERFRQATGLSMSEAVSELIERSEPRPPRIKFVDGFPTADVPRTGKRISTEDVLRAEAEPW